MVTVSLQDIFAGDVPRIDSVVIFLDQAERKHLSGALTNPSQMSGNHLVGFNVNSTEFDALIDRFKLRERGGSIKAVLVVWRRHDFEVIRGELPEYFKGSFPLKYRPSIREADLPADNENIRKIVALIKDYQAKLDRGAVGFGSYGMRCTLWARTHGLSKDVDAQKSSVGV
jgi:hypothetical protein